MEIIEEESKNESSDTRTFLGFISLRMISGLFLIMPLLTDLHNYVIMHFIIAICHGVGYYVNQRFYRVITYSMALLLSIILLFRMNVGTSIVAGFIIAILSEIQVTQQSNYLQLRNTSQLSVLQTIIQENFHIVGAIILYIILQHHYIQLSLAIFIMASIFRLLVFGGNTQVYNSYWNFEPAIEHQDAITSIQLFKSIMGLSLIVLSYLTAIPAYYSLYNLLRLDSIYVICGFIGMLIVNLSLRLIRLNILMMVPLLQVLGLVLIPISMPLFFIVESSLLVGFSQMLYCSQNYFGQTNITSIQRIFKIFNVLGNVTVILIFYQ